MYGIGESVFTVFMVFLILKLAGVIAWSWWWVTSPLWIPFVFALAVGAVVLLVTGFIKFAKWAHRRD